MKIFVWLAIIARLIVWGNTCTTWALISVIIRDGFGVPEVVLTILYFRDTVAVLILAKNVLLLFERKVHEVTLMRFF